MASQKTTGEIRALLKRSMIDFEEVENKALNNYLSKIFHICPFSDDICTTIQCLDCTVFKNANKK